MLKKQHQINAAFHFSYLFFIMFSVMSACFFVQGKSFINTGDGTTQFYAALIYLHNWEREIIYHLIYDHQLIIPLWDFSMGLGEDIITALHYYGLGDPLNLLVVFIPEASIEWFYYVTYGFRLWICGLSFLFMCKQTGISSKEGMVFSALAYCFSGFVLSHTLMYATFIYPMLFFPLILVGHKRIINNENPLLFLFSGK